KDGPIDWVPTKDRLTIDRFGLNFDFIEAHGLPWIDNLITSSGEDLGNPSHRDHRCAYVHNYIAQYGKRKCEANALVVQPEGGRRLCEEAVAKYLDQGGIKRYERWLKKQRKLVKDALPEAAERFFPR